MEKNALDTHSPIPHPVGGFVGIFLATIALFLFVPLLARGCYANSGLQICFNLLLLSLIYTLSNRKAALIAGIAFAIPFLLFEIMSVIDNSVVFLLLALGIYSVVLMLAIGLLAWRVLTISTIDTDLIFGAITIYLLAGILWAKLYFITETLLPGSFHGIQNLDLAKSGLDAAFHNQFDLLYYSFTTITSLGIGDILPLRHLAKSLTVIEAMFGQLFLATVVAKMVSIWREPVARQG